MFKQAIFTLAVLIGSPAFANDPPPDNAAVSATIAALRAGDLKELEWLVSRTGNLQFVTPTLPQKSDALKAISRCKAKEKSRGKAPPFIYFEFEWKCAKQTYIGKLVPDPQGQSVALIDFLTKAEQEVLLRRFPEIIGLPMPVFTSSLPPKSVEQIEAEKAKRKIEMARNVELASQFAKSFTDGDVTGFADRHSTYSTIEYGFFNPFIDEFFVERFWRLEDDFAENPPDTGKILSDVVAHAHAQLGKPTSWDCADADPYVECTWHFSEPATKLTSQILIFYPAARDWGIKLFWLRYETAEKLNKAKQRAAEAI